MVKKMKYLKFVSTGISLSFLRPFSKYENRISFIYNVCEKTVSIVNIGTLKHCENLLTVNNEIKQYVNNTIVKSHL